MSHLRPLTLVLLMVAVLTTAGAAAASAAVPDLVSQGRPRFLIGASHLDQRLGVLDLDREFRQAIGSPDQEHVTATTFKVWDEQAVRAWVRTAPAGSAIDFWHEPENDPQAMPPALWAQRTRQLADIVVAEGRVGQVTPAGTLMSWTLNPRSDRQNMLGQLLPADVLQALHDAGGVLGWDSYAGPEAARTPEEMFGPAAQFSTDHDLPWAVMETGAQQTSTDQNAADDWRGRFRYLAGDQIAAAPRWVLAWNPADRNGGMYAVQNFPDTAAVWRWAADRYGRPAG